MGRRPAIPVLAGPFPEPVHGVSVINARLAELMQARGLKAERIDLSPGRWRGGWRYHTTRAARTMAGFVRILAGGGRRTIMSVDGGAGLVYNVVLALAARLAGRPLLLYHHSTRYVFADSGLMRLLLAVTGPGVAQVFCSSRMAELFKARYRTTGPVFIIGNAAWIDPQPAGHGSAGLRSTELRLGFLSVLTLEKGLGRAIETLRVLKGQGLAAELVIAGTPGDDAARAALQQAQAEFGAALIDKGVLTGAQKAAYYAGLDVFLFPSLYPFETQSLVVPEALAAGTPVIAYDHRFVGEVLGNAGLLIASNETFAERAVAWIAVGDWPARRQTARRQFEADHAAASGQIDRLLEWATA